MKITVELDLDWFSPSLRVRAEITVEDVIVHVRHPDAGYPTSTEVELVGYVNGNKLKGCNTRGRSFDDALTKLVVEVANDIKDGTIKLEA